MGHAGAFALPGEPTAAAKIEALKAAGATIINHPSRFGSALKTLLSGSAPSGTGVASGAGASHSRSMHTFARRPRAALVSGPPGSRNQRRTIYLTQQVAFDLLHQQGVLATEKTAPGPRKLLAVSVNRSTRSPTVIVSASGDTSTTKFFDFEYAKGVADLPMPQIAAELGIEDNSIEALAKIVTELVTLFTEKEAFLLETTLAKTEGGDLTVSSANFGFDDAAFKSAKRHADIHALRDATAEDPHEVGVEKDGIVYIKLADGNIGTLVNGAGLAMNTVDALADAGGRAANFLDTGGKATSETVKKSFEVILTDPRVKVRDTAALDSTSS